MKKIISSLAIILTVALVLCMGVFLGACGGDNTTEATELTVTVVYPDNSPVDGTKDGNGNYDGNVIKVQFCDADGVNCYQMLNLGADGKISVAISDLKAALGEDITDYSLHINGLPDGYTYDQNIILNSKNASVTITLVASN